MKFALTQETSLIDKHSSVINQLSDDLKFFLKERDYGEDVKYVLIGIITINSEAAHFFKVRKPEYIDFKVIKDGIGNPVEISKYLGWDVKPDYESIKNLEGTALQSAVAQSIMESFKDLKLPKKIVDFDLKAFEQDLESFFSRKKLI